MTRQEFLEEVRKEGINPRTFDLDNVKHECYVLNSDYYDYRVYYSERGSEYNIRHFVTESEALEYLLEKLKSDPTTKQWPRGAHHAR